MRKPLIAASMLLLLLAASAAAQQSTVSPKTPHRRWVWFGAVDYRIHYQRGTAHQEYNWAAGNLDHVTGGTVGEYKRRNPSMRHAVYDILYGRDAGTGRAMERWLAANGYTPETAYLHRNGQRLVYPGWRDATEVAFNVGDPGYRAWRQHRTRQLVAPGADLIFFDVHSVNAINGKFGPAPIDEYPERRDYFDALNALVADHRQWVPAGFNVCNVAAYYNKPENEPVAIACGGIMAEFQLSPFLEQKWNVIDKFTRQGIVVEYSTGISPGSVNNRVGDLTFGNYTSFADRILMWMYSACLLTTPAERPDLLVCETYSKSWSLPFTQMFRPAFNVDVGLGLQDRRICQSGTDAAGQPYDVHCRELENALVLVRPQKSYREKQYGDQTAVTVSLPECTWASGACHWRMLNADGSQGPPLTSLQLRNSEAVILLRTN